MTAATLQACLSTITRYGDNEWAAGADSEFGEQPDGEYVKLADVQALLSARPAGAGCRIASCSDRAAAAGELVRSRERLFPYAQAEITELRAALAEAEKTIAIHGIVYEAHSLEALMAGLRADNDRLHAELEQRQPV